MEPAERTDLAEPSTRSTSGSRNEQFVAFVRGVAADAGNRARLRRSLRADGTISDDAWWLLGAWLPKDPDEALILARVAAWIAVTHPGRPEPHRTVAAELGDAANGITPDVARRTLEGVTREGSPTPARLSHITRCLVRCKGERIDWAQMISDLRGLVRGGDWAHRVRSRWYSAYYDASSPKRTDEANDDLTERNQP
ncbi:MAG: type I-E CRISPR-associated protein Cse2/CasB [bacterium]|nr:type I-E CRISPR-associated protein Cse2/CasB [bacterium]